MGYSKKKGYWVIEDGKLTGIKPHLAGDGGITVGFGDYLLIDDLKVRYQWQDVVNAYRNGTTTLEQLQLLKDRHRQAP
ncbi:MAG: hypothetical protein HDQ96_05435 [Lachnospiraceae bacterium]|nr:hypothetical protein [Lachnospiraceae bacterium]